MRGRIPDLEKPLGSVPRPAGGEIRLAFVTYSGRAFLELRPHREDHYPDGPGVRVSLAGVPVLLEALAEAERALASLEAGR